VKRYYPQIANATSVNWYFLVEYGFSLNLRKEYLNMDAVKIKSLLLIMSWTFWCIEHFLLKELRTFKYDAVFAHPVGLCDILSWNNPATETLGLMLLNVKVINELLENYYPLGDRIVCVEEYIHPDTKLADCLYQCEKSSRSNHSSSKDLKLLFKVSLCRLLFRVSRIVIYFTDTKLVEV